MKIPNPWMSHIREKGLAGVVGLSSSLFASLAVQCETDFALLRSDSRVSVLHEIPSKFRNHFRNRGSRTIRVNSEAKETDGERY